MKELTIGDTVVIIQKNGNRLMLYVYENGLCIKADMVGTQLVVNRANYFFVEVKAVDR